VNDLIAKSNNGTLATPVTFPLVNQALVGKKKNYQNSGTFQFDKLAFEQQLTPIINPEYKMVNDILQLVSGHVLQLEQAELNLWRNQYKPLQTPFSFIDYLAGGMELSMMVAVDFTASNGPPNSPNSLHYRGNKQMNEYARAIYAVGNILKYYDSDQCFKGMGFGGFNPDSQETSHCFALGSNKTPQNFNDWPGIDGLIQAYYTSLNCYQLSGPTYFSYLLRTVSNFVKNTCSQNSQKYTILLLLTDGVIEDVQETIDALIVASRLPLSVVIVGVGGADFSKMDALDSDKKPLQSKKTGLFSVRDLVQFVPFRQYANNPAQLAEVTLREIPMQVLGYMRQNGIFPNPRPQPMPMPPPPQQYCPPQPQHQAQPATAALPAPIQ